MDMVHFSLPFHWPGGAGRSTENGDRRSDSAITPLAMLLCSLVLPLLYSPICFMFNFMFTLSFLHKFACFVMLVSFYFLLF